MEGEMGGACCTYDIKRKSAGFGKGPLGRSRRRKEDNIKIYFEQIAWVAKLCVDTAVVTQLVVLRLPYSHTIY
jgi:hypothetical protein